MWCEPAWRSTSTPLMTTSSRLPSGTTMHCVVSIPAATSSAGNVALKSFGLTVGVDVVGEELDEHAAKEQAARSSARRVVLRIPFDVAPPRSDVEMWDTRKVLVPQRKTPPP